MRSGERDRAVNNDRGAPLTGSLDLRPRTVAVLVVSAVVVAVMVSAPQWASQYWLLVGFETTQVAALAQAWSMLAGYGGVVSLAVSAFVGVGSYATAKLAVSAGLGIAPSILAGGLFAVLFAVVVAVPLLRFRGLYFAIASLVLAQALAIFMSNYNGFGGNHGITLLSAAPTQAQVYNWSLLVAIAATVATAWIVRSRLGLGLMAIRDDEDVAERVGVATFRTKLVGFVAAALIMGLVGGIQAQRVGYIEPLGAFNLNWTIESINAAIIGGVGTIVGPLLGSVASIALSERLASYPELHLIFVGIILIAIIRLAPAGIWGTVLRFTRSSSRGRRAVPAAAVAEAAPADLWSGRDGEVKAANAVTQIKAGAGAGTPLLRAAGVGKRYGGVRAVDGVNLEIRAGEVLGIVGPNGAGKSTLIGLLSGAINGDGQVELFGEDATGLGAQARARRGIGRTHQVPRPFGRLTVMENLMVAQLHGARRGRRAARAECRRILERCGLLEFADVPAADLGLLRLKRLELARALAVHPRILLLDEIGAGLVEAELRELIDLIRSLRGEVEAILIVEHVLDLIRDCCDRLVVLDGGRLLVEGDPDEVLRDPQVAAVYLGTSGGGEVAPLRNGTAVGNGRRNGDTPILEVKGIAAQYGAFRALHDVSFSVAAGEVLALLGANGAGKTTTARTINGMLPISAGEIWFDGQRVDGRSAHQIVRLGVAHCMEGRRIFADLTVEENLVLGARTAQSRAELDRRLGAVYELFGALREHRGNSGAELSGGQQQMLAIGRSLMAAPRLVIFDEISLGLAPIMVDRLYQALAEINQRGVAMIVIEQNVERGLALADHVAVLEKGRVALTGTPADVRGDDRLLSLYVGEARG